MKYFRILSFALILIASALIPAYAQDKVPIVRSNTNVISIKDGDDLRQNSWTLAPEAKPDIYTTSVRAGVKKKVSFITDVDSISFDVEAGKTYDFIVRKGDIDCLTRIVANEHFFWSDPSFWQSSAMKTPFKPNITDEEKIAGLSIFWSEAKYNFVNFHLVPDLDWDKTYLEFIPRVLATKSTIEYYRVLQEFCAKLKDGHTNIYLPNQLDEEYLGRPPLTTRLVEDSVIIFRILDEKLKSDGIAIGQEVTEIDGIPVKRYAAEKVAPFVSDSTPQSMDVTVFQRFLLTGPVANPVTLTIRGTGGTTFKKTIPRLKWQDVNKLVPPRKAFDWTMLPGNIAHVKVNSMVDSDKADQLFAEAYPEIAKSSAMILDLRENGGGSSGVGYRILAFLTDKQFKGSNWYTRNYRPAFRAWGRPQEKFAEEAWQISEKELRNARGAETAVYDKPVVVLSSPRTFSAAEDFLVAFKPLGRGLIIGEPSGGSTGQPLFFQLPGGGSARVCSKHDTFPDGTRFVGVGVVPDVAVSPKIADFVSGSDAVLEAAIRQIQSKSGSR